jgi:outer membrane protein
MLNPVYTNLNALNRINGVVNPATGQLVQYPALENMEFEFYRPTEHETKVRLVQPIVNNRIYYNNKIKKELVNAEKTGYEAYRRELVFEVKSSYYKYLQTTEVLELIHVTEELLNENIRVNQKLYENNLVTIDNVYRAGSELNKLHQSFAEAVKNNKMALAYFNFLLNRELESEITIDSVVFISDSAGTFSDAQGQAIARREELKQLEYYLAVNKNLTRLNRSNALPTIVGVVDYGYEGEKYKFTNEYDYVMASVVLQWDLFNGLQNKRKIEQSKIDEAILTNKLDEVKQQINLQIVNSYYDLEAALKAIDAAKSDVQASGKAFDIIKKKFYEGQSPLIEFIDVRTSYTNARLPLI